MSVTKAVLLTVEALAMGLGAGFIIYVIQMNLGDAPSHDLRAALIIAGLVSTLGSVGLGFRAGARLTKQTVE